MEKEKNKKEENMLNGFFDRCRESYIEGSKQTIGLNPLDKEEDKDAKHYKSIAEYKLERIKRILLE